MVKIDDIKWGAYRTYEGPFFRGKSVGRYKLLDDEDSKILAVITATEGGNYMAINMYDRGILSSGLIQWIEAGQYSVSDMLGKVAAVDRRLIAPVDEIADASGLTFKKNRRNRWRFFYLDARGEVDLRSEQQSMFLYRSTGKKGTWDDASRIYAKRWAAAVSSVWEREAAQVVQKNYMARRLTGFALPAARKILNLAPDTDVGRAFKAAYLSFAANNPTWANRHLKIAVARLGVLWSVNWLISVLKELTFGPRVTIYPHRYKAIRPVLEKLYNLDLPDLATELRVWRGEQEHGFFFDTKEIQRALIILGYDLGPTGADGVYGKKTIGAVLDFERMSYGEKNKVPEEHIDGMMDQWTAKKMEEVLEQKAIDLTA